MSGAGRAGSPAWSRSRPARRVLRRLFLRSPGTLSRVTSTFRLREEATRSRVIEIARSFLTGYNAMTLAEDPEHVHRALAPLPAFYRPFAYEGAAMGFGPWAWLRGAGYDVFEPVIHGLNRGTVYQNYVGLGWWLDLRHGYRPRLIRSVADRFDARYRLIVFEGIGFRSGFLHAGAPRVCRRFGKFGSDARHVCFQGFGRSLWFVYMDDVARAFDVIERLEPPVRGDCYSGVGLGVAYSMLDREAMVERVLRLVPPAWRPDFLQGTAFGWEARYRSDPDLFHAYADRREPARRAQMLRALRIVHESEAELARRGVRASFYQRWRALTREQIVQRGAASGRGAD